MEWSLELDELEGPMEDMVLYDDVEAAKRLLEDDLTMSSQYEIVKMDESETSPSSTDCEIIRINITDKTAHNPELGTSSIQSEETQLSLSEKDNPRAGINNF